MQEEIEKFFEYPTAESYLLLRSLLRGESTFQSLTWHVAKLDGLLRQNRPEAVLDGVDELLPGCCLSPRLHFIAGRAALELGDSELYDLEHFMFQACLRGILATGDGSSHRPYLVTHATDVRDVLQTLDVAEQSMLESVEAYGEMFDVVTSPTGERWWFSMAAVLDPLPLPQDLTTPLN